MHPTPTYLFTPSLQARHGDVAGSLSGLVSGAPAWLPQGVLEFLHTPGHSPGHLVFIHTPTQSVIAGDAFSSQSWGWPFFKISKPRLNRPYPIATINSTAVQVRQSLKLASQPFLHIHNLDVLCRPACHCDQACMLWVRAQATKSTSFP